MQVQVVFPDLESAPGGFRMPTGQVFTLAQAAALSEEPIAERYVFRPTPADRAASARPRASRVPSADRLRNSAGDK